MSFQELLMNKQRQTETASAKANQEVRVISMMLTDLDRTIRLLDRDIAAEEERTQVFDIFDSRYSMLARMQSARRDNVRITIATLAQRLRTIPAAIRETVREAA
jgi:hypothetical protein